MLAKVKALKGYPLLKVSDWMPLAQEHYGLLEPLKKKDARYNKIHYFCTNAVTRAGGRARLLMQASEEVPGANDEQRPQIIQPRIEE